MYGVYYGQPYGAPALLSDAEPRPPIVKTNIYRDSYKVSGVFKRDRYTVLLFEDPFLFLSESDESLIAAEQDNNINIYKNEDITTGVFST